MRPSRSALFAIVWGAGLLSACSPRGTDPTPDAAGDAGADAVVDAPMDAPADADGGGDAGVEGWGVLSLNLHCLETAGTGFATNEERFDAIARTALERGARVLLLQEVCDDGTEDGLALLTDALSSRSAREWHGARAFAHVAWMGTAREAEESVAILTDVPLTGEEAHEHHAQGPLRRVMLTAVLGGDLDGLAVATFHLDHEDDAARLVQAEELAVASLLHAGSANVLVGGDLNDRAGTAAHDALGALGYEDASAALSATRIDHVFVHRGASVAARDAELLFTSEPVSDHPGVLVRLASREPAAVDYTLLEIDVDVGFGNALFVRGDQAPLSWDRGLPAINAGPTTWRFATTELSGAFEYKVLSNDTTWSAGDNFVGTAGAANDARVGAFE